jgi:hypothetical protein
MWPKTWRVVKGILVVVKVMLVYGLIGIGMGVKVVLMLVAGVLVAMAFLAHFVGGPRG